MGCTKKLYQLSLPFDLQPISGEELQMGYGSQGTKKDRTKERPTNGTKPRFNDVQFINYELDAVTQVSCKSWELDTDLAFTKVHELASDGYSFSLKWDSYSNSYAAFMQQKTEGGPNFGFILTGRGSTPYKALKQVLFKHYTIMDGMWEQFFVRPASQEIDD